MTAIIQIEKLTKSYGEHRGIIDIDLEVNEGEAFGFLGPNGAGKTTTIRTLLDHIRPTSGRAPDLRHRDDRRPGRDPSPDRLPARRVRALRQADRRPDDRVLREPPRRRRRGLPAPLDRAPRPRHEPEVQGVLEGQQAEGRPGRRAPAPAGPADPRRADVGPRPARPADVLRGHPRGQGRGPDGLPLEPHPQRGREDLRPGRDHPRRPPRQGRPRRGAARPRPPPGRAAVRRRRAGRRVRRRCPASATSTTEDHVLRLRVSGSITPVVREAAALRPARLRQPRAVARGDVPRRVRPRRRARRPDMTSEVDADRRPSHRRSRSVAALAASTGSAASSARRCATRAGDGPRRRDPAGPAAHRRELRRSSTEFDTPASRQQLVDVVAAVPADPRGPGRQGRQRRDARRLPPVQVRRRSSRSSSASGRSSPCPATLATEARRGSLEFVAATRDRPAAGSRSRSCPATSDRPGDRRAGRVPVALLIVGRSRQRRCPGDEISVQTAAGLRDLARSCSALAAGAVAFALAPFLGRGPAAGVAGAVMFGGFILNGYQAAIPALAPLANLTWFGWTSNHIPLAGPVRLGVAAPGRGRRGRPVRRSASRRSPDATSARPAPIPTPSLPRALVGLRGPTGRAFGQNLPTAIAWGIGIGLFGLAIAGSGNVVHRRARQGDRLREAAQPASSRASTSDPSAGSSSCSSSSSG